MAMPRIGHRLFSFVRSSTSRSAISPDISRTETGPEQILALVTPEQSVAFADFLPQREASKG